MTSRQLASQVVVSLTKHVASLSWIATQSILCFVWVYCALYRLYRLFWKTVNVTRFSCDQNTNSTIIVRNSNQAFDSIHYGKHTLYSVQLQWKHGETNEVASIWFKATFHRNNTLRARMLPPMGSVLLSKQSKTHLSAFDCLLSIIQFLGKWWVYVYCQ